MNRTYRQLLLACLSIISLIITCNRCHQRQVTQEGWNPQLEDQMHDVFYTQAANLTTNETEKQQYADCCLAKMKEMFPNGIGNLGTEMNDSVKIAIMKMGAECSKSFTNHTNIWQPEVIQQLKLQFYSLKETQLLPPTMRKEYVDCIAFKVITKFPTGLDSNVNKDTLKSTIEKARKDCLTLLVNKYRKLKPKKSLSNNDTIPKP